MRFRNEEEENFSLDLTPLVDVVFLLLIFFMVSTVFVDFKRRMDISLPTSKVSIPDEIPKAIELEITADKQVFLNGDKVSLKSLESALKKIDVDKKKAAIIRADKNLPYGDVIKVMGMLQSARILDISVAVQ
ncbi:MAG: biopolymer transporter ExbD [Nitrospinaceae bacterium]|jgi:biopolymer transport protein ExbD|nr:biopolymer transporter ExbD [Nitrospinaceae bacterium]|tara:strand:- start:301 stop:696 length:396 start_codon:yes stop_codon:yes gene_type:complete